MTAVWTGILAFLLTVVMGAIWTVLLLVNLQVSPAIPWSAVAMALVLWLAWSYLGGKWKPQSTRETRARYLRATPVSSRIFTWSLLAGGLSLVSLTGLWIVLFRLVKVSGNAVPDFSKFPIFTVITVLVMASLVSSIAEEAGFRGYFQVALESRFSGPVSVLIVALLIAPAHALTQGFVWPTMLFYFFVDIMLGTSAYLTKSILPGLAVHSTGLLIFFTLIWPQDKHRELISQSGADLWFWIHTAQAVLFAALGILAFMRLARLTKTQH
ncbi:MAG TPA: type II CAAX endopeptidase family protein [Acidobacteriaceae bacterium]|jgi:membrane protease YdiL (CAAX protease family)|nr:type II CAAX endopeptidase family protein [Acidobacteriaceae bacterium]